MAEISKEPARKDLTSRECAKILGAVIGGLTEMAPIEAIREAIQWFAQSEKVWESFQLVKTTLDEPVNKRWCTSCAPKKVLARFVASAERGPSGRALQWFECGEHSATDNLAGEARISLEPIDQWFERNLADEDTKPESALGRKKKDGGT